MSAHFYSLVGFNKLKMTVESDQAKSNWEKLGTRKFLMRRKTN